MKEITVAVIGSGSTYCPELVDGFLKASDSLKLKKNILYGYQREKTYYRRQSLRSYA